MAVPKKVSRICVLLDHLVSFLKAVAPLAWVPRNPSIFEQWVPEPVNFEKKRLRFPYFSVKASTKFRLGTWSNI